MHCNIFSGGSQTAFGCVTIVDQEPGETGDGSVCFNEEGEFPRLVLCFKEGKKKEREFSRAVVLADNVLIDTQADNIAYAVVVLIGSYFVFDLKYPKKWENFLVLLQKVVLEKESDRYDRLPDNIKSWIAEVEEKLSK